MAAFFDHYWRAFFRFIIFVGASFLRPATPRLRNKRRRDDEK